MVYEFKRSDALEMRPVVLDWKRESLRLSTAVFVETRSVGEPTVFLHFLNE